MDNERLLDRSRGALFGGAAGDALGYPVEFTGSFDDIRARYGEKGITGYDLDYRWSEPSYDKAQFSDDTQMTLYTAEGMLEAEKSGRPMLPAICNAYLAWYGHQTGLKARYDYESQLARIAEINLRRAPGNTCLSALQSISRGREPRNASKGCGGVMRVAPVGIYGAAHGWTPEQTARIAGGAAEITHLHPLSTYPSAMLAVMVQSCIPAEHVDADTFRAIVDDSLEVVERVYGTDAPAMDDFRDLIRKAVRSATSQLHDSEVIENILGGGWVGDEALAISIFCVLRHIGDFDGCLVSAVNHGGDSDSTGAVAGNIIGAIMGYDAIGPEWKAGIQNPEIILATAGQLCGALPYPAKFL